ncbi:MAG: type II secretion system F family protein [Actinobacteria bacterium]|nr:type II secretion system F family protein [Actinomycetota bacterium]
MVVPPVVYLASLALAASIALLVYALVGQRDGTRSLVATNLQRGELTSLREIRLARPTSERALEPTVARLSRMMRRVTPIGSVRNLERKLVLAGRPTNWPLERVLAAKVMLGGTGTLLAVLRIGSGGGVGVALLMCVFALLLFFTPDVVLSARAAERQRAILLALPDTLDQMTICMEAGLAFEAAMARASQSNTGPLAQEIVHTLQEIQVGVGRRQALTALADRSKVQDLRYFVTAILQAERYGIPIARVLNDQAAELRLKRRQRAEEAARKLPLKLLFPLILFIFPPLFIVVIGPAVLQLIDSFAGVGL